MIMKNSSPYAATMKINCSKEICVVGALGPLRLLKKSGNIPTNADGLVGETGGNEFYLGASLPSHTYLIFIGLRNSEIIDKDKALYF